MVETSLLTDAQRKPPVAVAKEAEKGLALREEHGRGGTQVGVRRAHQLKDRRAVSDRDVKAIYSYFARHTVDKQGAGWADKEKPSAGYIAWLLWGGDAGQTWIKGLRERLEGAENKAAHKADA